MIFQWSRKTGSWDLVAASGELLGRAVEVPGDCWEAKMTLLGGGHQAWATDIETIREWMFEEVAAASPSSAASDPGS